MWKRVSPLDVIIRGQSTTIILCIRPFSAWGQTPEQPGDPGTSLLLTSIEKTVIFVQIKHLSFTFCCRSESHGQVSIERRQVTRWWQSLLWSTNSCIVDSRTAGISLWRVLIRSCGLNRERMRVHMLRQRLVRPVATIVLGASLYSWATIFSRTSVQQVTSDNSMPTVIATPDWADTTVSTGTRQS